jgi:hypothetical protein
MYTVYCIKALGGVKIGCTIDLIDRYPQTVTSKGGLEVGPLLGPIGAVIAYSQQEMYGIEHALHVSLRSKRITGEWFDVDEEWLRRVVSDAFRGQWHECPDPIDWKPWYLDLAVWYTAERLRRMRRRR